ncbi:MAG: hypothetical protein L0Z62_45925 [Gemmataceae bacterium]|nr:hypothetical protein [Gemmataceae bacterium]
MPKTASADLSSTHTPRSINGVPLFTGKGVAKSRYTLAEKLRLLGCTQDELSAFADLFAPRKSDFAVTRAKSGDPRDWTGGRGTLTLDRVARHLLGDRLPGLNSQWVAPRGWDWTRFVAIDVDRRGDIRDFVRRCRRVEEALTLLDVSPEARLVVPTPSGGRHYYFFTSQRIRTEEISPTLARVGIIARKGRFELFPSRTQGLRMPFGHIPEQPHAPSEWLRFIERYQQGRLPMVNWEMCKQLAKRHVATRGGQGLLFHDDNDEPVAPAEPPQTPRRASTAVERKEKHVPLGVPKAVRQAVQQYEELLGRPVRNPGEIEELLDLGIRSEGTRHEAIKRLAWHFVFVRGCGEEEATREITAWAYQTGEHTSKDVQSDLSRGTHKVEWDVSELVRHFLRLREETDRSAVPAFAAVEVESIHEATAGLPEREQLARGRFLLEFLRFAKSHGRPAPDGWECRPAVRGIIRDWPGCSGMRYKPHLDWAQETGIIRLTREKRQTSDATGRARTYLLRVPPVEKVHCTLSREEALHHFQQAVLRPASSPVAAGRGSPESDTYQDGLPPKEEDRRGEGTASDPTTEAVTEGNERANALTGVATSPGAGPHGPADHTEPRSPNHADRPLAPAHAAGGTGGHPDDHGSPANSNGTSDPRGEHPGCAPCRLATGAPECPPVGTALPDLRDPPPGRMPTLPTGIDNNVAPGEGPPDFPGASPGITHSSSTFDPDQLPAPTDHAGIAIIIHRLKQQVRVQFPEIPPERLDQTWSLIEEMARQPWRSPLERWLLLADSFTLPYDLDHRRCCLIAEYRRQQTPNGHRRRSPRQHRRPISALW